MTRVPILLRALSALLAALLGLGLLVEPAAGAADAADTAARHREPDPRLTRPLYVDPGSQAALAARSDPRLAPIAATPQSLWVTEGTSPAAVRSYAARADRTGRTPVITLYSIPGRDCGGFSAGGLAPASYRAFVRRVAAAVEGRDAIAIVEPDAVPLLGSCAGQQAWPRLLRYAAKQLDAAGAWVYLDAGHAGWIKPRETARRLVRSGVAFARGISTDVSNFVDTATETAFATAVVDRLDALGLPGKHVVIDTSRNGAGAAPDSAWCNPLTARLGRAPEMVGDGVLDGYLWVKRPGESDGYCNGGPAAGAWWAAYALLLMGD